MLPFLKSKQGTSSGLILSNRKSDNTEDSEPELDQDVESGLVACAHDMIVAFNNKDSRSLAAALRAAFEILDSEPHVEGEHINSYDNLNKLAGESK